MRCAPRWAETTFQVGRVAGRSGCGLAPGPPPVRPLSPTPGTFANARHPGHPAPPAQPGGRERPLPESRPPVANRPRANHETVGARRNGHPLGTATAPEAAATATGQTGVRAPRRDLARRLGTGCDGWGRLLRPAGARRGSPADQPAPPDPRGKDCEPRRRRGEVLRWPPASPLTKPGTSRVRQATAPVDGTGQVENLGDGRHLEILLEGTRGRSGSAKEAQQRPKKGHPADRFAGAPVRAERLPTGYCIFVLRGNPTPAGSEGGRTEGI